jgi:hypothetical protein
MEKNQHPGNIQILHYSQGRPLDPEHQAHIGQCTACQKRVNALKQERAEFDEALRAEERLKELVERYRDTRKTEFSRFVRWAWVTGAVLILVVGSWVLLTFGRSDTTRTKGSLGANVYVKRGEEVVKADEGFLYRQGDKIRLGIVSPESVLVTVLVEQAGELEPIPNLTDVPVRPGKEKILPGSLFLACSRDTETLQLQVSRPKAAGGESTAKTFSRVMVFKCERP